MKIADHIKQSLEACDRRDLETAMLFACLAVDGTSKKMYPQIDTVGKRFKRFITDHLDIIELMHGCIDLKKTIFPFKNNKGSIGIRFEDVVYEKFRCNLAHGNELPDGYGIAVSVAPDTVQFSIDIAGQSMTLPESAIYALGLPCVLAPANADQKIGSNLYHYRDSINSYVVDRWWGKIECARQIMDFESQVKVGLNFPKSSPGA